MSNCVKKDFLSEYLDEYPKCLQDYIREEYSFDDEEEYLELLSEKYYGSYDTKSDIAYTFLVENGELPEQYFCYIDEDYYCKELEYDFVIDREDGIYVVYRH
jgi:hypothetical protein